VTDVFNATAFGTPRRQGQHRVFAIEHLNRGFLVRAEHGRVLRWMQIQANHIGRLGLTGRGVGGQIPFQSMRLEGAFGPDTRHRHMRDAPNCAAGLREDRYIDPSPGVGVVVQARTRASIRSVTV